MPNQMLIVMLILLYKLQPYVIKTNKELCKEFRVCILHLKIFRNRGHFVENYLHIR